MPRYQMVDEQAALGFVESQTMYIEREVNEVIYGDIIYPGLIPVDTSAPDWIKTVAYKSADKRGKANWIEGDADDIPMASTSLALQETQVHMAGIGYGYGLEEISQAMMVGYDLSGDEAMAARRAYEEMVERVALLGDESKGFEGLFDHSKVPTGTAKNGNWNDATADQILDDFNQSMIQQDTDTLGTSVADTVILPRDKWQLLMTRKASDLAEKSILTYIMENNILTAMTGRRLDIRGVGQLSKQGAGKTGRMISYRKSPDVLKMHIPMPHRFLRVRQVGPLRWEIPGIFRLGGVDIRRPAEIRYLDNI